MKKRWSWLYGGALALVGLALVLVAAVLGGANVPTWAPLVLWAIAVGWVLDCVAALWTLWSIR